MTQKKALKLSGIIFVVSLALLLVTALVARIWPDLKEPAEKQLSQQNQKTSGLPLEEEEVSAAKPNSYKVPAWSIESVLPVFHNSNLELIAKRQKNEQALKGV